MKPSTHRYILAPTLIGIHAILLLPLIFPPKTLRPPHFPDASGHPWPAYGTAPQHQKLGRLHLKYSVPLGFAGIAGVWISKQLAGNIPLPKDPRRKLLAMWLESSVLFGIGVLEEVWRYGLVRLLVGYMGGHGGYRGTTVMRRDEGDFEGPSTLWEGLYVMSWVWSIFECLYSWYGVRPNPHDCGKHHTQSSPISASKRIQAHFRRNSEGLAHVSHYQQRPPLGKRTRSDSIMGGASDETRAVFHSFGRKKRDTAAGTTTTNVKPREIEDRSIHFVDNNTTAAESESSRTAYDESIRPTNSSLLVKGKNTMDGDLETGLLSRLREIRREQAEEQADSDNGYGDDEESVSSGSEDDDSARSSIDSARFESVTPLLSSSLPYDPSQQHPHHESQALLQNQRQQITYNTMATANSLPLEPTDDNNEDELVTVHDCDNPNHNSSHENRFSDHGRDSTPKTQRSPIDRVYPSYPPYSAAYNHAHFSTTNPAPGPSTGYGTAAVITRPVPPKRKSTNNAFKAPRCSSKTVYGANVNTLPLHLPVLWRTAALLRHISHALIYAWAPALVFNGHFQWASFLVLFLLAVKKGWSTMEWFGGGASRTGLTKASIISFIIAVVLYFISLVLWGIVP